MFFFHILLYSFFPPIIYFIQDPATSNPISKFFFDFDISSILLFNQISMRRRLAEGLRCQLESFDPRFKILLSSPIFEAIGEISEPSGSDRLKTSGESCKRESDSCEAQGKSYEYKWEIQEYDRFHSAKDYGHSLSKNTF